MKCQRRSICSFIPDAEISSTANSLPSCSYRPISRDVASSETSLPSPQLFRSFLFTARCTVVQSAVLRLHVVRLSVYLSRDCPILGVPRITSGTGNATNFKFRRHIQSINRKKPIKNFVKSSCGQCQGLPKIFRALI